MRITIEIQDDSEYEFVKQLFAKYPLRLRYELETDTQLSESERKKHLKVIQQGGDGKSIKKPVNWQIKVRKDRKLPFKQQ